MNGLAPNPYLQRGMGMVDLTRQHDPMGYISPEHAQAALNVSLPVSMFMNMSHIPPRFFNQHQQNMQGRDSGRGRGGSRRGRGGRSGGGGSQNSQGLSQQGYSQDGTQYTQQPGVPLTQNMSQSMSQPGGGFSLSQPGLSQPELSQDPYAMGEFHSQADGLLSQDSTYQGDRSAFLPGASQGAQFSQPY